MDLELRRQSLAAQTFRRSRRHALALAVLLPLVSCGSDAPTAGTSGRLTELPRVLTASEKSAIQSSNTFAFDLLREVAAEEAPGTNVVVSPLSVSMALGMALNGAAGETFDAMRMGLRLEGMTLEEINASDRGLIDLLLQLDGSVQMAVAHSVWSREGFPFDAGFFNAIRETFDAEAQTLDFQDPGAKDLINGWVSDRTNERIDSIVDSISPLDILFLVNAVYFKGSWTSEFDPEQTLPRPFTLDDGSTVQVPTMSQQKGTGGVRLTDEAVVAELPYGAEAFSMVFVQPTGDGTLADLVASADAAQWTSWTEGIGFDESPVQVPRFELEYDASLNTPLKDMGMAHAFDPNLADFSKLTPAGDAHLSKVKHKVYVKVDEEGSEAAAATSVGVSVTSAPIGITVDRPFLMAIRERLSGTILFLGVVYDPR